MSGILGKKIGMTRIFKEDGRVIPITVVQCEPNEITQIKTTEKDGYPAIVLGFSKLKKPSKTKKFYHQKEFKIEEGAEHKIGDQITLESFEEVEKASKVVAISKGKGFQGVIKRHNFSRGPETHGSHHHREPGSIGACAKPGRVDKGKKMPGHMGTDRITLQNVPIVYLDTKNNLIGLAGPIPGGTKGLVIIQK
ncbi:50S ribosomal protein L3 [Candidatus Peregrinibacteria bacterium]|jgi:large subunit ribosomal protein L3|nr:50S ribosomal protein L3 [Candidatus Peregrinibacteria bacterium]MBT4055666.1 50S ribosomal protein L3 [Candidatus Peregrinibacteria bacterium]